MARSRDLVGPRGARLAAAAAKLSAAGGEAPPEVLCDDPIFILAAGWRTGSTLLQRLIASDDRVLVWGEPFGDLVPVHRLAAMIEPFAEGDPYSPHAIEHLGGDLSGQWIANLNPGIAALHRAHVAWFETSFAEPARRRGFGRWGCKWVRLDGEHAHYLRWLYPRCRLVFLVRHPLDAWRSYRALNADWHVMRPGHRVDSLAPFLRLWAQRSSSFLAERERLDALLVRYEDLVGDPGAPKRIADALDVRIDADVLETRVGGSRARREAGLWDRLRCARIRPLLERFDYRL